MFRHSSSTLAPCVALLLTASFAVQSFPLTRSTIIFAVRADFNKEASQQKKSSAPAAPQRTPVPSAAPPNAPQAVAIIATNRDTYPAQPGSANTGDTVTYHVVITNSGTTDATGVVFNDVINADQATLVGGSAVIDFIASADTYSSIGNVGINSANLPIGNGHTVLDNDTVNSATLTGFGNSLVTANGTAPNGSNTITTTNNGTVLLNADGTFTYDPASGFSGADTFFYTLTKSGTQGAAQVTINVTTPIWFINAAAGGTHVGTLANPFNCLTGGAGCFSNVNDGGAGHPADNHTVFMYSGNYSGGLTLRNGQKLVGQGASATLASIAGVTVPTESNALPSTGGANPVVTSAANGINIGAGFSNTLRGFTIGNTVGAKIASGANFGTLTVGNNIAPDMLLNGTGMALNLTSGAFAATSGFNGVTTTSSSSQGINLAGITGTASFGSTSISGNTTQCILVGTTTANINFGNTSCTGGTDGVSLQNNSGGTRTFGTLSVSGGSGNAFRHAVGGGNVTVGGITTLSSALDAISVSAPTNGNLIDFQAATSATRTAAGGNGVNWAGTAGATMTFSALTIQTNGGTGLNATIGGTINVTNATGTINNSTQAAPAIVANGIALNANFSAINSSGGTNGVSLTNVSGTSNFGGGALSGASGATFLVNGGTATVTYSGTTTQGNAARVVDIQNKTGGTINLSGAISSTGGTGTGVILNSNTGATVNLTGGIALTTNANAAFTATGGGTVTATQNNTSIINTLTTTTGTALNVANTTIGASGLTFRSISANGAANGIFLNNTGASGGLTVTGDGTNTTKGGNATGGTIQNINGADGTTAGIGVYLNNTKDVVLRRLTINGTIQNMGLYGEAVNGLTLQYSTIGGTIGTTTGANDLNLECPIAFGKTSPAIANGFAAGSSSTIDNCLISGGIQHNMEVYQQANTASLTISNSNITNNGAALGSDGINIETHTDSNGGTLFAQLTVSVQSCLFDNNKSQALQASALGDSFLNLTINGSTVQKTTQGNEGFLLQNGGDADMTVHVTNNTFTGILGTNILVGQVAGNASALSNLIGVIQNNNMTVGNATTFPTNRTLIVFFSSTVGSVSTANVLVDANTINTFSDPVNGLAEVLFVSTPDANTDPSFTATVTNNVVNITDTTGLSLRGIAVQSTQNVSAGCIDVRNNDVNYSPVTPAGVNGIRVRQVAPATLNLEQGASAGTAAVVLAANNPLSTTEVVGTVTVVGNATCLTAPTIVKGSDQTLARSDAQAYPLSSTVRSQPSRLTGVNTRLSEAPVSSFVAFDTPAAPVQAVKAPEVATASNQTAGYNERSDRSLPEAARTKLNHAAVAKPPVHHRVAANRAKTSPEVRSNHAVGRRPADDKPITPSSGGTVNVNVGTLTAGSTVTIVFQVTINNAQPPPHLNISNQGTVSGNNFANVLTDDPDTGAASDATLTPLTQPTAANGTVSGTILDNDGNPVEGAVVNLSGTQNRKFITDSNGHYSFDNVETAGFYTVTPSRVNYNFNPFSRSFSQIGELTEAVFTATALGDLANPLDTPEYFVRQQYVDLLGREPEEGGFNYWSDRILECGSNTRCVNARRRDVAAAFFVEAEFQQTGSFIYGLYKGALGRQPAFTEFSADRQQVVGGPNLESLKQVFAESFVGRPEFALRYQANTTAESFVDGLLENVRQSSGIDLGAQRANLLSRYHEGANLNQSRSLVLRDLTEGSAFRQAEYDEAFVLTEYFAYLRRDPEAAGYNFWLDVLQNREPGNYRGMVCSFITSLEYQYRFSSIATHGNAECGSSPD